MFCLFIRAALFAWLEGPYFSSKERGVRALAKVDFCTNAFRAPRYW